MWGASIFFTVCILSTCKKCKMKKSNRVLGFLTSVRNMKLFSTPIPEKNPFCVDLNELSHCGDLHQFHTVQRFI